LTDLQAGTSLSPPFRGGEHQGGGRVQLFRACAPSGARAAVQRRAARL